MYWATEWPFKDVHIQIPSICVYVTLPGKGDFADGIKDLRLDYPELQGWVESNHRSLYMKKGKGSESERENVRMDTEIR